jgi:hypothetical protein
MSAIGTSTTQTTAARWRPTTLMVGHLGVLQAVKKLFKEHGALLSAEIDPGVSKDVHMLVFGQDQCLTLLDWRQNGSVFKR